MRKRLGKSCLGGGSSFKKLKRSTELAINYETLTSRTNGQLALVLAGSGESRSLNRSQRPAIDERANVSGALHQPLARHDIWRTGPHGTSTSFTLLPLTTFTINRNHVV